MKILILRFSSIGDVVLTTPVIRCVKQQAPNAEVHVVTKAAFGQVLSGNPYIDKLHTFNQDITELYPQLLAERFDFVADLHNNLRSLRLKRHLGVRSSSVNKLNVRKFLAVNFKLLGFLPERHIVDRYLDTVKPLGVKNDGKGLDYFIAATDEVDLSDQLPLGAAGYVVLVVGGSYFTKQIPFNKLIEICGKISAPVVLMGGKEDDKAAEALLPLFPNLVNACGRYSISQSASIIQKAEWVITSDTGLMHIAAAFNKKIVSVWGNTIPEFGMGPYQPRKENLILEVKGLSCRPCSKLGYRKCPRGHFKCMNEIDTSFAEQL